MLGNDFRFDCVAEPSASNWCQVNARFLHSLRSTSEKSAFMHHPNGFGDLAREIPAQLHCCDRSSSSSSIIAKSSNAISFPVYMYNIAKCTRLILIYFDSLEKIQYSIATRISDRCEEKRDSVQLCFSLAPFSNRMECVCLFVHGAIVRQSSLTCIINALWL